MPATFAYLSALLVWGFATCIIWSAAALMCLWAQTRPFAWPTALAAAIAFPFVFAYQMVVAPAASPSTMSTITKWRFLDSAAVVAFSDSWIILESK